MSLLASSNFTRNYSVHHKLVLLYIRHKYSSIYFSPFYCHPSLQKKTRLRISSFYPLLLQSILLFLLSTMLALKSAIVLIYWQITVYSKCHPRVTLSEAQALSDWVGVVTMDYSYHTFQNPHASRKDQTNKEDFFFSWIFISYHLGPKVEN